MTRREGDEVGKLELKRWVLRCFGRAISYLEGERGPKNWSIVTERVRKCFFEL